MGFLVEAPLAAFGAYMQGHSQAESDKYNAEQARQNSAVAVQNEAIAGQAGSEQAAISSLHSRATVGALKANQAASGVDVNSGSALDTRVSAQDIGELDAMTIRSNATKEAYGYKVQSENDENQANLDTYESKNAELSGDIGAVTSVIGSADDAANNWMKYATAGGFG